MCSLFCIVTADRLSDIPKFTLTSANYDINHAFRGVFINRLFKITKKQTKDTLIYSICDSNGLNAPTVANFKPQRTCLTPMDWGREDVDEHQGQR